METIEIINKKIIKKQIITICLPPEQIVWIKKNKKKVSSFIAEIIGNHINNNGGFDGATERI